MPIIPDSNGYSAFHYIHTQPLPFEAMPPLDQEYRNTVIDHVNKTVAKCDTAINRIYYPYPHVDILSVPAGLKRPWITLVTCGMGARKMPGLRTPPDRAYAELALCLPQNWPQIVVENGQAGPGAWIVPMIHYLARIPFEYDSWLGDFHTVPNGNPPEPLADGSQLRYAMLTRPRRIRHPNFHEMILSDNHTIHFWAVYFITENEFRLKEDKDEKTLMERLKEAKVDELLQLDRESVCKDGIVTKLLKRRKK